MVRYMYYDIRDGQVIEGEEGEYLLLEDLSLASEANYRKEDFLHKK